MTTATERAIAAASAGASLLDRLEPKWFTLVDTDRLDIDDTNTCILGQVYGDYYDGLRAIAVEMPEALSWGGPWPYDHGFMAGDIDELQNAWCDEITRRLTTVEPTSGTSTTTSPPPR